MTIDYGLQMVPSTALQIANSKDNYWLLQPELKSIKDGLKFGEANGRVNYISSWRYRGYLNTQGERQGVGIAYLNGLDINIG